MRNDNSTSLTYYNQRLSGSFHVVSVLNNSFFSYLLSYCFIYMLVFFSSPTFLFFKILMFEKMVAEKGNVKPSLATTSQNSGRRSEQSQVSQQQGRLLHIIPGQGHSSSIALAPPLLEHLTPANILGIQCHLVYVRTKLMSLYQGLLNRNVDQDQ